MLTARWEYGFDPVAERLAPDCAHCLVEDRRSGCSPASARGDTQMTVVSDVIASTLEAARHPCITCSFQAEGMVVLHALRMLRPDIPVLFLDTVHHFVELYEYRDRMTNAWGLNLINVRAREPSPGLWQTSTDACCARHKVEPLFTALEGYDVWFTGLRRQQSPSRANLLHPQPS